MSLYNRRLQNELLAKQPRIIFLITINKHGSTHYCKSIKVLPRDPAKITSATKVVRSHRFVLGKGTD